MLMRIWNVLLSRPWWVLGCAGVLAMLGLLAGSQVELRTSRRELAPRGDPEQARMDRLTADFAGSESVVAAVEGRTPGVDRRTLTACVDRLAGELARDERVASVYHRVPADWMLTSAAWLVPADSLKEAMTGVGDIPGSPGVLDGFGSINDRIARSLRQGIQQGQSANADRAVEILDGLGRFLEMQRDLAEGGDGGRTEWLDPPLVTRVDNLMLSVDRDPYLVTGDGRLFFLVIAPKTAEDDLPTLRRLVYGLREVADRTLADTPDCSVRWTGTPVMTVEEMDAVRGDSLRAVLIAVLGVGLLTFLVFHDHGHVLLVLGALAIGLAWSVGVIFLYPGYLNLITSSFLSTLIGVGIAYGIHPVSEYELLRKHHESPLAAIRDAWRHTGAGVVVAAVTTSAAFFSILMMRFPGFSEMGAVAGQGVLLCLVAMIFVLPAVLVLYGRRRPRPHGVALFDKVWSGALTRRICSAPNLVLSVAALLTIGSLWLVPGIRFSTDIMKLLPRRAASLQLFERMVGEPSLSPIFNLVPTDSLDELRALADRASREPTIGTFQSVLDLLPGDAGASSHVVAELRKQIAGLSVDLSRDASMQHWRQSIGMLQETMEEATDLAFDAGMGELVEVFEERLVTLDALSSALETALAPTTVTSSLSARLSEWFAALELRRQELLQALSRPAPSVATLPTGLRDRFVTTNGRLIAYLYPTENIYVPEKLDRYVAASRRVSGESVGFPIMLQRMSGRITDGFYKAVGLAALLVFTILWFDFRSLRDTFLALVPLCLGVIWMLGGMRLLNLDFNFANLVAVPLILGVGIDNGVHVIHRWRLEGAAGMPVVLKHTGRAICIASGTTMVGFGSLALADHRGMASLGQALILGVGGCLITSTVVLPNLLVRFGLSAQKEKDQRVGI